MGLRCPRFNFPQGHSSNSGSYATNWDLSLVRRLHIHIKIRGIDGVLKDPGFTMLSTFSFTALHKMSNLRDLRVSFQHDSQFDACRPVPLDLVALFDGVGPAPPVVRDMIRALLASAPKQASMRWGLTEGGSGILPCTSALCPIGTKSMSRRTRCLLRRRCGRDW